MIAQGLVYYRHTDLGMDLGTGLRFLLDYAVCYFFLSSVRLSKDTLQLFLKNLHHLIQRCVHDKVMHVHCTSMSLMCQCFVQRVGRPGIPC